MILILAMVAAGVGQPAPSEAASERCRATILQFLNEGKARAAALQRDLDYAEAHNNAMSPELTQHFVAWYQRVRSERPSAYPALWRTDLTSAEEGLRNAAVEEFQRGLAAEFRQWQAASLERRIAACPWREKELRAEADRVRDGG